MTSEDWSISCSTVLALFIACATTISAAPMASTAAANAQITVLYDAFGKASTMKKDWGYAALVEYGGKRILFDTGNNPDILAQNVKAKGFDLRNLDFVVMSHRHGDHMGGLTYVRKVNSTVKIYAPKEGFGIYGAELPSRFYRKDAALPREQRYYDGTPPELMQFGSAWPGANFQLVDKNIEIAPDIHLIALVSDKPGTLEDVSCRSPSIRRTVWSSWLLVRIPALRTSLKLQLRSISAFTSLLAAFISLLRPILTSRGL